MPSAARHPHPAEPGDQQPNALELPHPLARLTPAELARNDAALVSAGDRFRRAFIDEMTGAPAPALPPFRPTRSRFPSL